ncbi:HAD family hydrolase [Dongshaea marina]|uniref:HAD family hydrolase n=1 Tax=Dongshaea marina TaxID=2047966 RepID=UPI00131F0AAD|nr:HAD family phosphatase [Dongshaea marina]
MKERSDPCYLLCDFDGTLVDSESLHLQAWQQSLAPFTAWGGSEALLTLCRGLSFEGACERLVAEYRLAISPGDLNQLRANHYQALTSGQPLPLKQGAERFIRSMQQYSSLSLSLVTGSTRAEISSTLSHLNWWSVFDTVVTRDDVQGPKPSPESYQLACANLGVHPSQCFALEDSLTGLWAARDAGVPAILVASHPDTSAPKGQARVICHNLDEAQRWLIGFIGSDHLGQGRRD